MPSRTDNFQKFVKQKKGSAVKEEIKQHKKKEKKERAAAINEHFERKRAERLQQRQQAPLRGKAARPGKFSQKENEAPVAKTGRPNKYPPKANEAPVAKAARPNKYPQKASETPAVKAERPNKFAQKESEAPAAKAARPGKYSQRTNEKPVAKTARPTSFLPKENAAPAAKAARPNKFPKKTNHAPVSKTAGADASKKKEAGGASIKNEVVRTSGEQMPLNKYIAHGGVCSRRDAAILVKEGKVSVNGTLATDPGMKVTPDDVVTIGNKKITPSRNFVYILLNKPKDYITTSEDPQGRKTVLDLVRSATTERVYPVGRLDRNTSGVLLLTNDGELAQKLSHPKHEVKKVYEVTLDRALTKGDMDKIASGITLEDGFVAPDVIAYADAKDKSVIGVEIHSGRNRIVRRIFEHLKYDVKALDRVMYAGLTKKDVQRGTWRFLKDKEIRILKFMNQSFVKVRE
ncbi:MAG: rRNA pseudouridine synthase [Segetibacter sp.]|nr:rRNA pseudouridine synthase [Segetibacter sp.]